MNRRVNHLILPLLAFISACDHAGPAPLAGAAMGGAFALTNEEGRRVTDRDFAGRYRLVYFGYTSCPDVCPLDVAHLMAGLKALELRDAVRGAKITPLFITVDPVRDTPQALKTFTDVFHPRLIGLTGSATEIAAVAERYGIAYQSEKPDIHGEYRVEHSNQAVLYDPTGAPIAIIPSEGPPNSVADELARWVK